eukprot:GCRY01000763.1.p1 GENE.GCRY01000763.1~~GCRY01000763.1.p1  ORF type:complete len:112 (+),score=19.39 GCRY01000763.1:129-464(+)
MDKEIDTQIKTFKDNQANLQILSEKRQKLETQKQENDGVLAELNLLVDDAEVFHKVGPVLCKISVDEARNNVQERLEFIQKEIKSTEASIATNNQKQEEIRNKIISLQQKS